MIDFPNVEWIQNNVLVDPSGTRHLNTTGFIKKLDTSAGGALSFGNINVTNSGGISSTALTFAHAASLGDASGIFNMRFFLVNVSAWNTGTYRFLWDKTIHFTQGKSLNDGNLDLSTTVPATANLRSTLVPEWVGGAPSVSGVGDQAVTQYVHLAVLAEGDTPIGTYGGAGAGSFRYRLLYDFS